MLTCISHLSIKLSIIYYRPTTLHYTPDCLQYPYPYMHRLEGLRACTPTVFTQLPQELKAITTLLILPKWQTELQGHQDPTFTKFITHGIQHGFRIGFNYSLQNLKPCWKNLRSTAEHPSIVDAYLHNELIHIKDPPSVHWFQPSAFGPLE